MQGLWLLLFGIVVGVFGGLFGIGGGLIMVPGLMLFFGLTQPEAQGTSVAVMIPPIGLFAAMVYYQNGFIKLPIVGWVAFGFMMGALIGAKLVPVLPISSLRIVFGLVLLYQGFNFVMNPGAAKQSSALPTALATVLAGVIAWALRKKRPVVAKGLEPPDEDIEYHI
ncbi:MAG: sulfite exporter TauE/SafE family protein [Planctomycetaceae bacterium]